MPYVVLGLSYGFVQNAIHTLTHKTHTTSTQTAIIFLVGNCIACSEKFDPCSMTNGGKHIPHKCEIEQCVWSEGSVAGTGVHTPRRWHFFCHSPRGNQQSVPTCSVRHSLLHLLPRDCFLLRLFLYSLFLYFLAFLDAVGIFFAVRTEGICHKVFAWQHFPQIFMLFFICCKRLYFLFLPLLFGLFA